MNERRISEAALTLVSCVATLSSAYLMVTSKVIPMTVFMASITVFMGFISIGLIMDLRKDQSRVEGNPEPFDMKAEDFDRPGSSHSGN